MKSKFLALTLALTVMVMGAGYAAWTDQVDINTTVNTGQLDVHYVDLPGNAELQLPSYATGNVEYTQDAEDSGQNNWDVANVTFGNMYPGAKSKVTLKIANNSTMPVGMDKITDTRTGDWSHFNQIGASLRFFNANGQPLPEFNQDTSSYANPWSGPQLAGAEIPVGGYATISFTFTANDNATENSTYTFNPRAVFKQFNASAADSSIADVVEPVQQQ